MPCKEEVDDSQREYLRPEVKSIFLSVKNTRKRRQENTLLRGMETGCCHNSGLFRITRSFRSIRITLTTRTIRITLTTRIIQTTRTILPNPFMLIIHRICALSGQRYKIPSPLASKRGEIFLSSEQIQNDAGGVNTSYKVNLCR